MDVPLSHALEGNKKIWWFFNTCWTAGVIYIPAILNIPYLNQVLLGAVLWEELLIFHEETAFSSKVREKV